MKIGVFDSGIGGQSVANALRKDFPSADILSIDDRAHMPYGVRSVADITSLTDAAIQPLLQAHCDGIVLACNTATAAAIEALREKYPLTPFIGLEPMLKPASVMTKSGVIAVCATPATLGSDRYATLKKDFASGLKVIEPDCSEWAYLIENGELETKKITKIINDVCAEGADVIVLACTHYHWIKEEILTSANGRAAVIDPTDAISKRVREVLAVRPSA